MNKTFPQVFWVITILALMLVVLPIRSAQAVGGGSGSISLPTLGSPSTEDFDTLANSGTTNNLTINGWFLDEVGTSGNNNGQYQGGTGSGTGGDTYSFGALAATERALGGLLSGTLTPTIGAQFINNTGSTVTALDIAYTGEMWRAGATNRNAADRLDFQLSTDATALTTGTWTDYNSLDFNSPNINTTLGALDGNAAGNKTAVSFLITGLSIPDGSSFWIRWSDFNITGSDDGLAVDDFSITPDIGDTAPSVASTVPVNGATDFLINANLSVTFSEPVDVTASWFTLVCSVSGTVATTASGGPTTFTLDPDSDLADGETCDLTVIANQVSDQDATDPPDNMVADVIVSFTAVAPIVLPITPIHDVQGNGAASPLDGSTVAIEGIVVGDFQDGASGTNGDLNGFYVQEEDADVDADPATSEGIFVFDGNTPAVNVQVGDKVRVEGVVSEFNGLTELTPSAAVIIVSTGNALPTTSSLTFPVAMLDDFERNEGMLVTFPQALVIAEYFNYDRFGELVLALPLPGETRPFSGTAIDDPGAPANARTLANSLRRITLDDGLNTQNPAALRHPNGAAFDLTNLFRGGDTVQNAVGVLSYDFGLYRIQPTGAAVYTAVNPRPAAPDPVGGTTRVAAMNTLNYFLTLDPASGPGDNACGPAQNVECRGADDATEFTRQRDKLLAALTGLDADVIGLNELENTTGVEPLADIVAGLSGYDYINTGTIGTDAIKVGLIYRPAVVTPVGAFQILDSTDDPRFIDTKSRPSLAQTFQVIATGAKFTVVVNHLKSKGSDCNDVADPDAGDGQGNCSGTRTLAAQALVDWLATDPTGSGDPDFLIMGDLNSYAKEDPIKAVEAGADDTGSTGDDYTNLISLFQGLYAYSYTFDGQAGYLDHALANASMVSQITGATEWHINSDESDVLDYDTTFKPNSQDALYEPNSYRSSDHDAVVIGLDLVGPTTAVNVAGVQARINPKGKIVVKWRTTTESQIAGFNIYRRVGKGAWEQINGNFKQAQHAGDAQGEAYRYTNRNLDAGTTYRYKIQVVYLDNHTEWTKVVKVRVP